MKKFTLVLGLIGLFLSASTISFSQGAQGPKSIGKAGAFIMSSRAGELDCPANSIFSQPPTGSNNGYFSDESTLWLDQRIFENFSGLTSPVGGVTFWGILYEAGDCHTGAADNLIVTFYQDNAGSVGTMVQSFPLTVTPTVTGSLVSGVPLLRYDLILPSTVSLTNGWIMIYRLNPGNSNCALAWVNTTAGDNLLGYSNFGGGIINFNDNVAFCLTGQSGPGEVPVSNWALFIGIGLILAFTVVRFRKIV